MNNPPKSPAAIADRAAGCIMGAFIGDALGLGPHWYYDLDELRAAHGDWITGYTDPKPDHYHAGMKAGDLSQTGIIMEILARSVAENDGYSETDFTDRLDRELLPQLDGTPKTGPGGYTNHSFRQVWENRVKSKKTWGETGGNADTSEAAERCAILAARYATDLPSVAKHAHSNTRLTQTDSLVAQQSVAFALLLALLIQGEPFDPEISDKLTDRLEETGVEFTGPEFGFASPDALLLPSWIAESARENAIDPPWKVSKIYGMSCAISYVLPGAYYLAARFPNDFENAVLHAINGGGQNMSRASLTGALVGAQIGLTQIPPRFIENLTNRSTLLPLAQSLATSNK